MSPDILLIEYPLEWFQNGKPIPERLASLEDKNSGEGAVAWAYCKRTNAKCLAYDIEGRNKYYMKVNYFEREEIFLNAAVSELERLQPVVFEGWARLFSLKMHCNDVTAEIANSRVCDEISKNALEYLFSVLEQYLPDLEVSDKEFAALFKETWERRNRAMAKNICNTAKEHPGDRILVTMGREHRYILKAMLEESCQFIELIEFWEIQ
ncbi:MAG: hypothetical protein GY854_16995 [Deltaproteobacteria bacterium]|nr:hypothetical protein [Deltaproteobacteria bacterium]